MCLVRTKKQRVVGLCWSLVNPGGPEMFDFSKLSLRYLLSILLGVFQELSTCIQTSIWLGPHGWVLECFTPSSCSQNACRLPSPLAFHTVHDKKALHLLSSSLFSSGLAFTFRIKICLRRYCVSLVIKSCLFKTFLLC